MLEFNYEDLLKFRDKVALEVLKAMLINKPIGNCGWDEEINQTCRVAYKYADSMYSIRMNTAPKCKADDYADGTF